MVGLVSSNVLDRVIRKALCPLCPQCVVLLFSDCALLALSATPTSSLLQGFDLMVWLVDWGRTHTNKQSDHTHIGPWCNVGLILKPRFCFC